MTLGQFIKARRTALDLTLEELAAASGTTKSHIWSLEQDGAMPSLKLAVRLAVALGVSVNALGACTLTGEQG